MKRIAKEFSDESESRRELARGVPELLEQLIVTPDHEEPRKPQPPSGMLEVVQTEAKLNRMKTTTPRLHISPTNLRCPFCGVGVGEPCMTSGEKDLRNDTLGAVLVHVARIEHAAKASAKRARTDANESMSAVRILVADDFAEWRTRICSILQERPEWKVVGEACNGLQAVQMTTELRPNIVLLDIGMPILNGIAAAACIRQVAAGTTIIFVTQDHDADTKTAALATGAIQYLLKINVQRELLHAIDAALDGRDSLAAPD